MHNLHNCITPSAAHSLLAEHKSKIHNITSSSVKVNPLLSSNIHDILFRTDLDCKWCFICKYLSPGSDETTKRNIRKSNIMDIGMV